MVTERLLRQKTINKFQVFNIESYLADDKKSEGMILDALGIEEFGALPSSRYVGLIFILNAISGVRPSPKQD